MTFYGHRVFSYTKILTFKSFHLWMRCLVLSLYRYAFASSKLSTNSVTLVNGLLFPTFLNSSLWCNKTSNYNFSNAPVLKLYYEFKLIPKVRQAVPLLIVHRVRWGAVLFDLMQKLTFLCLHPLCWKRCCKVFFCVVQNKP